MWVQIRHTPHFNLVEKLFPRNLPFTHFIYLKNHENTLDLTNFKPLRLNHSNYFDQTCTAALRMLYSDY